MAGIRWPFAAARDRRARAEAAVAALEDGAAAAQAQAARLAEAVTVSHRALAMLGDRLVQLAEQPARVDVAVAAAEARTLELIAGARESLMTAAASVATAAADRVAEEIAPARAAAELHAEVMRASLERLRGETAALDGAGEAARALVTLSGTVQTGASDTLAALARRSEQAAGAAERAVARIEAAADRLDTSAAPRRTAKRREA